MASVPSTRTTRDAVRVLAEPAGDDQELLGRVAIDGGARFEEVERSEVEATASQRDRPVGTEELHVVRRHELVEQPLAFERTREHVEPVPGQRGFLEAFVEGERVHPSFERLEQGCGVAPERVRHDRDDGVVAHGVREAGAGAQGDAELRGHARRLSGTRRVAADAPRATP